MNKWQTAKMMVDNMEFPDEIGKPEQTSESHKIKMGESHSLNSYKISGKNIGGFEAIYKYNYCPVCKKIISKYIVILNNAENSCYIRYFKKHGKDVGVNGKIENTADGLDDEPVDYSELLDNNLGVSNNLTKEED